MNKHKLANLPTRIDRLKQPPTQVRLWIKRDDQTGTELMGNKVRKLEYSLQEALDRGADTVITCGGIQSNHARATAAACAQLGLYCLLLLKEDAETKNTGNYFLDQLFGAEIVWVPAEVYENSLDELCLSHAGRLEKLGHTAYIMPIGASNGIGTFGYFEAYQEILAQEQELGVTFDTIVTTVGSGGTYAGLCFANLKAGNPKKIVGIPVAKDAAYFEEVIRSLWQEFTAYLPMEAELAPQHIHMLDGWAGRGYALNEPEDFTFIREFARAEGIVLDNVYTGKAMRGLYASLEENHPVLQGAKDLLFIHTGGMLGLFGKEVHLQD